MGPFLGICIIFCIHGLCGYSVSQQSDTARIQRKINTSKVTKDARFSLEQPQQLLSVDMQSVMR
jgi:hypothetical protein